MRLVEPVRGILAGEKSLKGPGNKPIIAYSLNSSIALDIIAAMLVFVYQGYLLIWQGSPPFAWIVGALFLGDFYFRLWTRPVRQARFFDDHFELSGFNVNIKARYDVVERLSRFKQTFGDFRSNSRVSFAVEGDPHLFVVPNRTNRKLRLDIYSLLFQRVKE